MEVNISSTNGKDGNVAPQGEDTDVTAAAARISVSSAEFQAAAAPAAATADDDNAAPLEKFQKLSRQLTRSLSRVSAPGDFKKRLALMSPGSIERGSIERANSAAKGEGEGEAGAYARPLFSSM